MPSESDRAATNQRERYRARHDVNVAVPIDFSTYSDSARFNVSLVFSANHGADVGNVIETNETE
jgi:hypothetical protein